MLVLAYIKVLDLVHTQTPQLITNWIFESDLTRLAFCILLSAFLTSHDDSHRQLLNLWSCITGYIYIRFPTVSPQVHSTQKAIRRIVAKITYHLGKTYRNRKFSLCWTVHVELYSWKTKLFTSPLASSSLARTDYLDPHNYASVERVRHSTPHSTTATVLLQQSTTAIVHTSEEFYE